MYCHFRPRRGAGHTTAIALVAAPAAAPPEPLFIGRCSVSTRCANLWSLSSRQQGFVLAYGARPCFSPWFWRSCPPAGNIFPTSRRRSGCHRQLSRAFVLPGAPVFPASTWAVLHFSHFPRHRSVELSPHRAREHSVNVERYDGFVGTRSVPRFRAHILHNPSYSRPIRGLGIPSVLAGLYCLSFLSELF